MKPLDIKHIIGLLIGVVLTLVASQAYEVVFKSDVSHAQIVSQFKEDLSTFSKETAKQFSTDEQRISTLEADNKSLNSWLVRIETKLDKVISTK